jgi:hypothetical protein
MVLMRKGTWKRQQRLLAATGTMLMALSQQVLHQVLPAQQPINRLLHGAQVLSTPTALPQGSNSRPSSCLVVVQMWAPLLAWPR